MEELERTPPPGRCVTAAWPGHFVEHLERVYPLSMLT
jgi:hypothetical protein